MINTWAELIAAFKVWWNTELKFERKPKEPEVKYENLLRPAPYKDPFDLDRVGRQRYNDAYIASLRARYQSGGFLTQDEMYRLRMDQHVRELNDSLEHQPEKDNNLPDPDNEIK